MKAIPTEQLEDAALALGDLRRKYRGEEQVSNFRFDGDNDYGHDCPLCNLDSHYEGLICRNCPWFWFTGSTCTKHDYDRDPIPIRLQCIDLWEGRIKHELSLRSLPLAGVL